MRFKLVSEIVAASFAFAHLVIMTPCGQIAAQELLDIDTYDRETIYIHHSILGDGFVKNGYIMDIGAFGSNLEKEIARSEYALEEMSKVRKYRIAGTVANLAGTAFSVTGLVLALRSGGDDSAAFEAGSLIVGGICGLLAEGFNRSAMAAMNRAVWLYNRDVVSGRLRLRQR
jgi:hypothetical protein